MGIIKIQDTGYIKPTNEGKQASAGNRANSGTTMTLVAAQFTPSLTKNIQNKPELGSTTPSEINIGSLENMKFQLTCKLKRKNTTTMTNLATGTFDITNIPALLDMAATKTYVVMWYQYSDATKENNNGQLIKNIALNSKFGHQFSDAEKTKFTISDNFYHLHVSFLDIQPRDSGESDIITYTLRGVVLKADTSVLT